MKTTLLAAKAHRVLKERCFVSELKTSGLSVYESEVVGKPLNCNKPAEVGTRERYLDISGISLVAG